MFSPAFRAPYSTVSSSLHIYFRTRIREELLALLTLPTRASSTVFVYKKEIRQASSTVRMMVAFLHSLCSTPPKVRGVRTSTFEKTLRMICCMYSSSSTNYYCTMFCMYSTNTILQQKRRSSSPKLVACFDKLSIREVYLELYSCRARKIYIYLYISYLVCMIAAICCTYRVYTINNGIRLLLLTVRLYSSVELTHQVCR